MLKFVTHHFRHREHKKHNRTSHRKSSDDGSGGHSDRTAKTTLKTRLSFGCFLFSKNRNYYCRAPPYSNQLNIT